MVATNNRTFLVTNRSASRVHYSVPELGILSRDFQPGETKKISYAELEGLGFIPGGIDLIRDYLLIQDPASRQELVGNVEPEYNMTSKEVKDLILTGSMDEWLDCLDFAPEGVIDLIKTLSVELPLTDTRKMQSFQEKTGINLARMIQAKAEEEAERKAMEAQQAINNDKTAEQGRRRVKVQTEETAAQNSTRRTTGSKYKVVEKK